MILFIGKDPVIFFSKKLRILIHLNLFINVILHFFQEWSNLSGNNSWENKVVFLKEYTKLFL